MREAGRGGAGEDALPEVQLGGIAPPRAAREGARGRWGGVATQHQQVENAPPQQPRGQLAQAGGVAASRSEKSEDGALARKAAVHIHRSRG